MLDSAIWHLGIVADTLKIWLGHIFNNVTNCHQAAPIQFDTTYELSQKELVKHHFIIPFRHYIGNTPTTYDNISIITIS